ncbi:MAG: hypothetical protein P1R58_11980 [bacterium]|nr:hypothetical protein [bacterium]
MKPILMAGTSIVILALISYTIGIVAEQKGRKVTSKVTTFLTLGVILDITATICMIIGSEKGWFTLHGVLGFSSLGGMLTDVFLIWKHRLSHGQAETPRWLHIYSRSAYIWWVIAFISGGLLVAINRAS